MNNIDKTKSIRQKVYADYTGGNTLRAAIVGLILERYKEVNNDDIPLTQITMIWDIVNKLSRIAVTPDHIDSWHDISVYASLIEETLTSKITKEEVRPKKLDRTCPNCGSINTNVVGCNPDGRVMNMAVDCANCNHEFETDF